MPIRNVRIYKEVVIDRVKGTVLGAGWGVAAYEDGKIHYFKEDTGVLSLCGVMLADDFEGEKGPKCGECKKLLRSLNGN